MENWGENKTKEADKMGEKEKSLNYNNGCYQLENKYHFWNWWVMGE